MLLCMHRCWLSLSNPCTELPLYRLLPEEGLRPAWKTGSSCACVLGLLILHPSYQQSQPWGSIRNQSASSLGIPSVELYSKPAAAWALSVQSCCENSWLCLSMFWGTRGRKLLFTPCNVCLLTEYGDIRRVLSGIAIHLILSAAAGSKLILALS